MLLSARPLPTRHFCWFLLQTNKHSVVCLQIGAIDDLTGEELQELLERRLHR